MTLYLAGKDRIPEIAKLERLLFSDPWSEKMLMECLAQKYYQVEVCEDEGEIVGYRISTHVAGEAELLRIGVLPARQGQGIGKRLMESFAGACRQQETPSAFLEVRVSNTRAIQLYRKFGFVVTGYRKQYYREPAEDACLMAAIQQFPPSPEQNTCILNG